MKQVICFFLLLCIGITTGSGLDYTSDYNKDGKPDKWCKVSSDGTLITTELDQNFDGVMDAKSEYYKDGKPKYEEFDYNYDGKMDTFYYYTDGKLEKQEIDSNYDQKIDIWVYLINGIYIERIERDLDFDGKVDNVKNYGKEK
ncbi:MAG: hypothetical protein JXJ04_01675 [Spirochaetales bacterium]|nr:hypothetical protein [Spirochaetales bacterium]